MQVGLHGKKFDLPAEIQKAFKRGSSDATSSTAGGFGFGGTVEEEHARREGCCEGEHGGKGGRQEGHGYWRGAGRGGKGEECSESVCSSQGGAHAAHAVGEAAEEEHGGARRGGGADRAAGLAAGLTAAAPAGTAAGGAGHAGMSGGPSSAAEDSAASDPTLVAFAEAAAKVHGSPQEWVQLVEVLQQVWGTNVRVSVVMQLLGLKHCEVGVGSVGGEGGVGGVALGIHLALVQV